MTSNVAFLLRLLACLLFCNCAMGGSLTKDELVGVYHVDVSGSEHAETIPTNFYAVVLTLNPDGSFLTTNATREFFFPDSSQSGVPEVTHGTWEVQHDPDMGIDYLNLTFSTASWRGDWSNRVEIDHGTARIRVFYYPFKDSGVGRHFYLTKQKR